MASLEEYLGSIDDFAGNFAPRGYALCAGQLIPIQQNSALFAIIGTTYGGDGVHNFGLPDLRPVENGQKMYWWEIENPVPTKIICTEGIFPSRD